MKIRKEEFYDVAAIRIMTENAFGRQEEARLVDALREKNRIVLSLVAEEEGEIVGHILFTNVRPEHGTLKAAGLGPVAVPPEEQGKGIGSALIREGLKLCREYGYDCVATLGEPAFYERFDFVQAGLYGFRCTYDSAQEAFLIVPFNESALKVASGTLFYEPEFDATL